MSETALFTSAAQLLSAVAGRSGLVAPGFRSPPRVVGVNRTIRRSHTGEGGVVAVRLVDRPLAVILGDMIEGVIVLNNLNATQADRVRTHLWSAMSQFAAAEDHAMRVA